MVNRRHGRLSLLALSTAAWLTAGPALSAEAEEQGRFHHVHLNVSDIEATTEFYSRILGVVPVDYAETIPALMAERAFLFLNEVEAPIPS
ncbi:MAG: VOC family protein, partial [Maricaulaceae bacterium]